MEVYEPVLVKCKKQKVKIIAIGASAGGIDALMKLLPALKRPSHLSVMVVIHMKASSQNLLPSLLQDACQFNVKEAEPGERIKQETIYIAAPDYHLSLEPNSTLSLSNEEKIKYSRPSIDVLFESAAYAFKGHTLGVLLTGANDDGAQGLKFIKKNKGIILIQCPEDAEYKSMPEAGISSVKPDLICPISQMVKFFERLSMLGAVNER